MDFLEHQLEENIIKELQHTDDASVLERIARCVLVSMTFGGLTSVLLTLRAYLITDVMSKQGNIVTSVSLPLIFLLSSPYFITSVRVQRLFQYCYKALLMVGRSCM